MSDENGVSIGAPLQGRMAEQARIDADRAASRSREAAGAWRQANLDMKAQALQDQGWESDPQYQRSEAPSLADRNRARANRYVTAADLEADPYAAMDRAAALAGKNPLDRLPKFDEDGLPSKKRTEAPRVPMPEAPVLMELDDNPETALQQLGGMFRNALGALDRWRTRRAERRGATAPATGTTTSGAEPARGILADVAGRSEQPAASIPDTVASIAPDVTGSDPELAGIFAQLHEHAAGWNNPAREPVSGEMPDVNQPDATPAIAPIAEAPAAEVSQAA